MPKKLTKFSSKPSVAHPRKLSERQVHSLLGEIQELMDLSTLKHQKKARRASDETQAARLFLQQSLQQAQKATRNKEGAGGWKDSETRDMLLLKRLVETGKYSDFPHQKQRAGMVAIGNLGETVQESH